MEDLQELDASSNHLEGSLPVLSDMSQAWPQLMLLNLSFNHLQGGAAREAAALLAA